tara:strand:+ start:287 stop:397 length:111 start_codon:yes stop_codon:yes gene_type:complete
MRHAEHKMASYGLDAYIKNKQPQTIAEVERILREKL